MYQPIDDLEFWKDRLQKAKEIKNIKFSVYTGIFPDEEHKKIIREHISKDASVIDVGCGYGRCADWFDNYVGIDFSPDFIKEARSLSPNKKFEVQNFLEMDYPTNHFDWAVSIGCKNMCISNMGKNYWKKVVREMRRVARKVLILEMTGDEYEII